MAAAESRLVHCDANFLVEAASGQRTRVGQLEAWLAAHFKIQVSAVAWSEFLCGPILDFELEYARSIVEVIDPFTEDFAMLAAELFNLTGRRPRSHVDCMIAAHAIRREATLATADVRDFRRFERYGLQLA